MYKRAAASCQTIRQRLLWWRSHFGTGWVPSPPPRFLLVLMLASQILFLALIRLGPAASFWNASSATSHASLINLRLHVGRNAFQRMPIETGNSSTISSSTSTAVGAERINRSTVTPPWNDVKQAYNQHSISLEGTSQKPLRARSGSRKRGRFRFKQEPTPSYVYDGANQETDGLNNRTVTASVIAHDEFLSSVADENQLSVTRVSKDSDLAVQKGVMEKQSKDVLTVEEDALYSKTTSKDVNEAAKANTATEVQPGKAGTWQDKDMMMQNIQVLEALPPSKPAATDVGKSEEADKDADVGNTEHKASPNLWAEAEEKQSTKVLEKQMTFALQEEDMEKQTSEATKKQEASLSSQMEDMEKQEISSRLKETHTEQEKLDIRAIQNVFPALEEEVVEKPNVQNLLWQKASSTLEGEDTKRHSEFSKKDDASPSMQEEKMQMPNTEALVVEEASSLLEEENREKQEAASSILQEEKMKNQNEEVRQKPSETLQEERREQTMEILKALKESATPDKALDVGYLNQSQISSSKEDNGFSSSSCKYGYIYVYDLSLEFNHDIIANCSALNPWYDVCIPLSNGGLGESLGEASPLGQVGSWFNTNQFMAEVVFHNRILQHPCLTDKPELASGFYVPYYAGLDVGRYLWTGSAERRDRVGKQLVEWLQGQESWKRSKGLDHFMMVGRITWDFRRSKDEDWGSGFFYNPGVQGVITRLVIERNPWDDKEMGVPYLTNFHPQSDSDIHAWQQHLCTLMTARSIMFSFAGSLRSSFPNDFRSILRTQCLNAGPSVCRSLDCSNRTCEGNQKTMELFMNSMFCLQPRGDSFTRRSTFDCLLAGSIPVFFWHMTAYHQYPWHLPADPLSYSVFISKEEMRNDTQILDRLRMISSDKLRAMQESVIQLIPRLVYAASGFSLKEENDAFSVAIDGMLKKFHEQAGLEILKR